MSEKVEMEFVAESNKLEKALESATAKIKNMKKSTILMINNMKKAAQTIAKLTKHTDDYVTSMRLMNMVFKDSAKQAGDFVEKMAGITGLDEQTLMRQVSMFRQLGESINLTDEYADKLSEGLTTLAAKMSILYNKDYVVMANALQRAIQGTQETLKIMTGIEATELGQQAILNSYGINRQVSSLNEAERSIVMYASIMRKVSNDQRAYGDAVNSVAWQKQMLVAQTKRLATALGAVLYPILQKILPVLNAIIMVLTEIIMAFAKLVGFTAGSAGSADSAAESYDKLAGSIAGAGKAAQKQLRGFDKLNNISTPSAGGAGAGGGVAVDPKILGILDEMDNNMLNIRNKATEIRDRIFEWLGFTTDANGEIKDFDWTLGSVLVSAGLIAIAFKKIYDVGKWIGTIFAGEFWKSVFNPTTASASVTAMIESIKLAFLKLVTFFSITFLGSATATFVAVAAVISVIVAGIILVLYSIATHWQEIINIFKNAWEKYGQPIIDGFKKALDGLKLIMKNLYEQVVKPIIDNFIKRAEELWRDTLKPMFEKIADAIGKMIQLLLTYWNNVLLPIINWLVTVLGPTVETIINFIIDVATTVFKFLGGIVNGILDIFIGVLDFFTGVFTGDWKKAWEGIVGIFKGIGNILISIFEGVVNLIIDLFNGLIKAVFNVIKGIVNGVGSIVEAIAKVMGKQINFKMTASAFQMKHLSIPRLKDGGFPQGEDGLFYANHNELVGEFSNGRTAVANNGQIVEGIKSGVYSAMMSALSSHDFGAKVTIEASGDDAGLMNFITFKQREQDRQYN